MSLDRKLKEGWFEEKKEDLMTSKCQFQNCCNKATRTIPALIGPSEEYTEIHVCERHHQDLVFDYKCSCEIVSVKEKQNE